ncbi:hypothetical protein Q8F55_006600 [Vanrija albida]|uniref:Uncharacterized protein n=1 Tax=Vanrija albida TaxID=181172 RepID=A0ABR3PXK5_9TREE
MRILAALALPLALLVSAAAQLSGDAPASSLATPTAPAPGGGAQAPLPLPPAPPPAPTAPAYPALFLFPTRTQGWTVNGTRGYSEADWRKQEVAVDVLLTNGNKSLLAAPLRLAKDVPRGVGQVNVVDTALASASLGGGYVLLLVDAGNGNILGQSDAFEIWDAGELEDPGVPTISLHVGVGYGSGGVPGGGGRRARVGLGGVLAAALAAAVL